MGVNITLYICNTHYIYVLKKHNETLKTVKKGGESRK
jgi:hypothetical protein